MGIGHQGKTLKQLVKERDRLTSGTGYYQGLEKLDLHDEDPAKITRFNTKLGASCITAREVAKLVAASPAVRTFGEVTFMLLTPEGDCVAASFGLVGHVTNIRYMMKAIAEMGYEDNPGIRDGDIFSCNHPRFGAAHPADNFTLVPVFYQGELIAWAVGLNHILENGPALGVGSSVPFSPTTYTDGFVYPPMKTGENLETFKWWDLLWETRTRMPTFNILDNKMRVTGAILIRNRALEIADEFGIDYFRKGLPEIIERERRRVVRIVKAQAVPGIYRDGQVAALEQKGRLGPLFPQADKNFLIHNPLAMHIKNDGTFLIDCTGASSQGNHARNGYEAGVRMALTFWFIPTIVYTTAINSSFDFVVDLIRPEGTILNVTDHTLGGSLSFLAASGYIPTLYGVGSKVWFLRGALEESIMQVNDVPLYGEEGIFDNGLPWAWTNFSGAGGFSMGARPYKDGEFALGANTNPQSDYGEIEEWELYDPPLVTIGRTAPANFCGHGKFRGGLGWNLTLLCVNPGKLTLSNVFLSVPGVTTATMTGMSGAYPGAGMYHVFIRGTNMRELIAKGEGYPSNIVEIYQWLREGKLKAKRVEEYGLDTPNAALHDGDIWSLVAKCAPGWGDPLERFLDLAEKDLNEGWITPDVAEKVYGVVAQLVDGRWKVDEEATAKTRWEMREKRGKRAVTAKEWWKQARQRVLNKQFLENIRELHADTLKYEKPRQAFTDFWQVDRDYEL